MSTPAGWYDDGSGRQRWWDGAGWTENVMAPAAATPAVGEVPAFAPPFVPPAQTADAAATAAAAVAYRPAAVPVTAPTRPRSRKGLVFTLIGAGLAIVVGAVVLVPLLTPDEEIAADDESNPLIAPWESRTHDPEAEETERQQDAEEEETVYWDEMAVGDCWRYDEEDWSSGYADIVACELPHSDEIYEEYTVDADDFPGDKALMKEATAVCMAEFTTFVGIPYDDSELDFWVIAPTEETWSFARDRLVQCSIYDPDSDAVTGTLEGAGR